MWIPLFFGLNFIANLRVHLFPNAELPSVGFFMLCAAALAITPAMALWLLHQRKSPVALINITLASIHAAAWALALVTTAFFLSSPANRLEFWKLVVKGWPGSVELSLAVLILEAAALAASFGAILLASPEITNRFTFLRRKIGHHRRTAWAVLTIGAALPWLLLFLQGLPLILVIAWMITATDTDPAA
jgi:hypothetical protein